MTWTHVESHWRRHSVRMDGYEDPVLVYVRDITRGPTGWSGKGYGQIMLAGPRGGRPRHGKIAEISSPWEENSVDNSIISDEAAQAIRDLLRSRYAA